MKKIVITGSTSLLGTALIDECINRNIEVLALCNRGTKKRNYIPESALVHVIECSLEELSDLKIEKELCKEPYDAFFHLAWAATKGNMDRDQLYPQVNNIRYSLDAVELASLLGCSVFIGAGSQAEYGRRNDTLTEETVPNPETAYGMAKLCAGQMSRLAAEQKGMKHIWTRILSAYGPRYQPQTVINYTLSELLQGREPQLSSGEQIWDFIYSGDVARALLLLAEKGKNHEVYVIGSGKSDYLKNYIIQARKVLQEMEGHELPGLQFGKKTINSGTVMHLACDITKISKDTGFYPEVSFDDGIKKTVEWLKDNL